VRLTENDGSLFDSEPLMLRVELTSTTGDSDVCVYVDNNAPLCSSAGAGALDAVTVVVSDTFGQDDATDVDIEVKPFVRGTWSLTLRGNP
jgi:hypothetical protein